MAKSIISILCIVGLLIPSLMTFAQDEVPPEAKADESKVTDSAPYEGVITDGAKIDSVSNVEVLPESLAVVPSIQPITPPYTTEPIEEYGFEGSGRDIVIGAAVLTGWILVAFLAANQRSD